jgi:hypothetical protein
MIGPTPYKSLAPKSSDTKPPLPAVGGIVAPASLKLRGEEFLGLAEAPEVEVPSTYDEALRNDELLENIELLNENTLEVFPNEGTKDEIAFGVSSAKQTDVRAFGGNVGKSVSSQPISATTPLTTEEKRVVLQNSVVVAKTSEIVAGLTGFVRRGNDLGSKLHGVVAGQTLLQTILTTTIDLDSPAADIIEPEEFVFPITPTIIDGGDF